METSAAVPAITASEPAAQMRAFVGGVSGPRTAWGH